MFVDALFVGMAFLHVSTVHANAADYILQVLFDAANDAVKDAVKDAAWHVGRVVLEKAKQWVNGDKPPTVFSE